MSSGPCIYNSHHRQQENIHITHGYEFCTQFWLVHKHAHMCVWILKLIDHSLPARWSKVERLNDSFTQFTLLALSLSLSPSLSHTHTLFIYFTILLEITFSYLLKLKPDDFTWITTIGIITRTSRLIMWAIIPGTTLIISWRKSEMEWVYACTVQVSMHHYDIKFIKLTTDKPFSIRRHRTTGTIESVMWIKILFLNRISFFCVHI